MRLVIGGEVPSEYGRGKLRLGIHLEQSCRIHKTAFKSGTKYKTIIQPASTADGVTSQGTTIPDA